MAENRWKYVLADKREVSHDRAMTKPAQSPKNVVIVVFPDVQSLDFVGPLEVFAGAHKLIAATARAEPGYRITIASLDGAPITTSSGLEIVPRRAWSMRPENRHSDRPRRRRLCRGERRRGDARLDQARRPSARAA